MPSTSCSRQKQRRFTSIGLSHIILQNSRHAVNADSPSLHDEGLLDPSYATDTATEYDKAQKLFQPLL